MALCVLFATGFATGCATSSIGPDLNGASDTHASRNLGNSLAPDAWVAAAVAGDGPGHRVPTAAPEAVQVRNLPKSRRGNPAEYTVGGVPYEVLDSAQGYIEQGKASWYGRKFHGRETSSGERYDMYDMTAAHKHLPLPTFVKVTRIDTGDSIVVKVNDRGPFVPGRIIDLSYQAAATLGILASGTAPVIIEALSSHLPAALPKGTLSTASALESSSGQEPISSHKSGKYLQVGAFSQPINAQKLVGKLATDLSAPMLINHDAERALYRVWVGPLSSVEEHSSAVATLQARGIVNFTMVTLAQ